MERPSLREECAQFANSHRSCFDLLPKGLREEVDQILLEVISGSIPMKSRGFNMTVLAEKVMQRIRDKTFNAESLSRALSKRLKELRSAKPTRRG